MDNFPQRLYAKIEGDGDETYFIAEKDPDSHAESGNLVKVGVYKLIKVVDIETKIVIHEDEDAE